MSKLVIINVYNKSSDCFVFERDALRDVTGHMTSVSCVAGSEAVMATPVALLSESVLGWSIFTIVLLVRYMNYPL